MNRQNDLKNSTKHFFLIFTNSTFNWEIIQIHMGEYLSQCFVKKLIEIEKSCVMFTGLLPHDWIHVDDSAKKQSNASLFIYKATFK